MHIGLIGGIGPAATDLYYRALIRRCADGGVPLDLTMVHADSRVLLANFHAKDRAAQAAIYRDLTVRLAAAGAGCVAVTSIGGHFCIDAFREISPLPVINLLDAVPQRVAALGLTRVGLLGTDTVMQTGMYGALAGIEALAPPREMIAPVHAAYAAMAVAGAVTEAQRALFLGQGREMIDRGAEAVLLAGTDLFLAFDGQDPGYRVVDAALLHVEALVEAAAQ